MQLTANLQHTAGSRENHHVTQNVYENRPARATKAKDEQMKRGHGFIEILACQEEIIALLAAGYTLAHAHRTLSTQGKITTKYSNFHETLTGLGIRPIRLERLKIGAELAGVPGRNAPARQLRTEFSSLFQGTKERKKADADAIIIKNDPSHRRKRYEE